MWIFFMTSGVCIVNSMDILSQSWQAILTACAVSTVAVIVAVACTQEWLEKRGRKPTLPDRPATPSGEGATPPAANDNTKS